MIVLTGEAGIGKSRLVQVLKERVAGEPHVRLEGRGSPYYTHSPLYPVIDLLPRMLGWGRDESAAGKLEKLEAILARYELATPEAVSVLASLLSLPPTERYPLPQLSPERQRQRTLETLVSLWPAMAEAEPVLLIVEDLHWVDPTTLELLAMLLDRVATARECIVLTTRPAFRPPWASRAHLTALTVSRFSRRQTEQLVTRIAQGKALPAEVGQQIVAKTDGVPLFVEELTKMVLESGLLRPAGDRYELTAPLPPLAIPSTLQDSLRARLDRLATVKEVAQLGATLGRAFPYSLLRAVSTLDESTLHQELGRLVDAELLYQRGGAPPQATYVFKHALIQEAAYQSILRRTRQQYHQRIARAMLEQFSEEAEARPEFVAHHDTESGLIAEGVEYWKRAGQGAAQRPAHAEAVAHFEHALRLLAGTSPSPQRDQQEIALQVALGWALAPSRGYTSTEVEAAFERAHELAERAGDVTAEHLVLSGLWVLHLARGQTRLANGFAERGLALAREANDNDQLCFWSCRFGETILRLA